MSGLERWPTQIAARFALSIVAKVYPWVRPFILGHARVPRPATSPSGLSHPYGVPVLDFELLVDSAHAFIPVCFDGVVGRVGIPASHREQLFGAARTLESREADATASRRWSDALFAPRMDVYSYWLMRATVNHAIDLSVTSALVCSPPPSRCSSFVCPPADRASHSTEPSIVALASASSSASLNLGCTPAVVHGWQSPGVNI